MLRVRSRAVPVYKALVFDMNELSRWEPIEAADDLAAVRAVPRCEGATKIELWRDDVRIAIIKCFEEEL